MATGLTEEQIRTLTSIIESERAGHPVLDPGVSPEQASETISGVSVLDPGLGVPPIDVREYDAEDQYLHAGKLTELLGRIPGFEQLSPNDFRPGRFIFDKESDPENNWQKMLGSFDSRAPLYDPNIAEDTPYVSSFMESDTPGKIEIPLGPFDFMGGITTEAADVESYSDIGPAVGEYYRKQKQVYDAEGESPLNDISAYLDASVFAVGNSVNQTMKAADYWAAVIPLALISGWDYLTTSDEEAREEQIDKSPALKEHFDRQAVPESASEEDKQAAFLMAMESYHKEVASPENKEKLYRAYNQLADQWNIPVDKVPSLLTLLSFDSLPTIDKFTAAAGARLSAIDSEDYWSKPYYYIPSENNLTSERPPQKVFYIPTTRAEAALDISIATATYGLSYAGVKIPSLLFNNFLGRKSKKAADIYGLQKQKRLALAEVEDSLSKLGENLKFTDRLRNYVKARFMPKAKLVPKGEQLELFDNVGGALKKNIKDTDSLKAEAARLRAALADDDAAIRKVTGYAPPSIEKYGRYTDLKGVTKSVPKHFYPIAPLYQRVLDEVLFTQAANSVASNFVFSSETGIKYAEEGDLEKTSPFAHFLMAMTPLVGGIAVGTFKNWDDFDPLLEEIAKQNKTIDPELLKTGQRRLIEPVLIDSEVKSSGIKNPFRKMSHTPDTESLPTVKDILFDAIVLPRGEFSATEAATRWQRLGKLLQDGEYRQIVDELVEDYRKLGVADENLDMFSKSYDDLQAFWEKLDSNPDLQAKRFLNEPLTELDLRSLEANHKHLGFAQSQQMSLDFDPRGGRPLVENSYVVQRQGDVAVVASELPTGKLQLTTVQSPRGVRLSGDAKNFYDLSLEFRRRINATKLRTPKARHRALVDLGNQTATTLSTMAKDAAVKTRVVGAVGNLVAKDIVGLARKILDVSPEDLSRSKSRAHILKKLSEIPELEPMLDSFKDLDQGSKDVLAEYLRGRLEIGSIMTPAVADIPIPQTMSDEASQIFSSTSNRIANTAFETTSGGGLDGVYTRLSDPVEIDPTKPLTKTIKGKEVTVDTATYIDDNFIKPYLNKSSRREFGSIHDVELKGDRSVVVAREDAGTNTPRAFVRASDQPTVEKILKANPDFEAIDLADPKNGIGNQLYALTFNLPFLKRMNKDYVLGNVDGAGFRQYLNSPIDAYNAVYDLRHMAIIATSKNITDAVVAFHNMVKFNRTSGQLPNTAGIVDSISNLFAELDDIASAKGATVQDVLDFYSTNFFKFREARGGSKAAPYLKDIRIQKPWGLKKFKVSDINVLGANKHHMNKDTLVLRKKGTNELRIYGDVARGGDMPDVQLLETMASAGHPVGHTYRELLNRQITEGTESIAAINRGLDRSFEERWFGGSTVQLDTATEQALKVALGGEGGAGVPSDSGSPDPIRKGSGTWSATQSSRKYVDGDVYLGARISTAAGNDVSLTLLSGEMAGYGARDAERVERYNKIKEASKGATGPRKVLVELAARAELMTGWLGHKYDPLDYPENWRQRIRDRLDHVIPGAAISKHTGKTKKLVEGIYRTWGRSDAIKAQTARLKDDWVDLETMDMIRAARQERNSFFSRVNPFWTNSLEYLRLEVFEKLQQHNGLEFYQGTRENMFRDSFSSKIERFNELTPEQQSEKIFLSGKADDYVLLSDLKLMMDQLDQTVLAPRRYRHERMSGNNYEAWLQNYYPRIWDLRKSVDNWRSDPEKWGFAEGTEEYDKIKEAYAKGKLSVIEREKLLANLPPMFRGSANLDEDQAILFMKYQEFLADLAEGKPGKTPAGRSSSGWRKQRTGRQYLVDNPSIYTKDYFDQLLMRGFVPVTWNPVEMIRLKADEMDNYVMGVRQLDYFLRNGLVYQLDFKQLLGVSKKYRRFGKEKFQGRNPNFEINFVDVTPNIAQITPSLFTDDVRAINRVIDDAVKEKNALGEFYVPDEIPLETQQAWVPFPKEMQKAGIASRKTLKEGDPPPPIGAWLEFSPYGVIEGAGDWAKLTTEQQKMMALRRFGGKKFYADPQVARIIQNITSPGIVARGTSGNLLGAPQEIAWLGASLWDKWRRGNNYLNSINLGWSMFHASSVGLFESMMGDITRLMRTAKISEKMIRESRLTTFQGRQGEADKVINKNWFLVNAAVRSVLFPLSILGAVGQFPVQSRLLTGAIPNVRTGRSEATALIPSAMKGGYRPKTPFRFREAYEKHFTQAVGDSGQIQGKSFFQVLDEFASHLRGKEWTPFQDTFIPPLLNKADARYDKYNVGSFGAQIENVMTGVTPTNLVNPIFMDIINAGIDSNFLNPIAAQAGSRDYLYTFNRSWIDSWQYVLGNAPTYEYGVDSPATTIAMKRGTTALSMPLRYVGAAAQEGQRWLFEGIIPRAKYAAWMDNMYQEVYRNPQFADNPQALARLGAEVGASIDNRFGMLNYDNLLMDKTMKDLMFLYWRAPAWKLGTKREILGGIRDLSYLGGLKAQRGLDRLAGLKGKVPRAERIAEVDELSHRASYLFGMFGMGAYMAFLQYFSTGTWPSFEWNEEEPALDNFIKNLQKLWFPLSGQVGTSPYGPMPVRLSMPTYHKDPLKWFENYGYGFIEHFAEAMPPLWQPIRMAVSGKDHRGFSIYRSESDAFPAGSLSWLTAKSADFGKAAVKDQLPFSITQAYTRLVQDEAPGAQVAMEYMLGIKAAPSGFNQSLAVEKALDLMIADLPSSSRPQYQKIVQDLTKQVRSKHEQGQRFTDGSLKRLYKAELEKAGLRGNPKTIVKMVNRTQEILNTRRDPVVARRQLFESTLAKAKTPWQINEVVKAMDKVEFTAYFGDTMSKVRDRVKSLDPGFRGFDGDPVYLDWVYQDLKDTVARKAKTHLIPGLFQMKNLTVEQIHDTNLPDEWKITLKLAVKERSGGR